MPLLHSRRLPLSFLCAALVSFLPSLTGCGSGGSSTSAAPATTATLSATSFDFGGTLVGSSVAKQVVTVANTGANTLTLASSLSGDSSYSIASAQSCGASLAAGASCTITVNYAPATASGATAQTATLTVQLQNAAAGTANTVALTGTSAALTAGAVSSTNNPQVALYTMTLPYPGSMTVSFGTTTAYGRQTWTKSIAAAGSISMFVAGMLPNASYHMQASVRLANGSSSTDADHTFATGTPQFQPTLSASTTAGMTPQPGIEQLSVSAGAFFSLVFTDLQGNILWSYALPGDTGGWDVEGAKMLSNGDFLLSMGNGSSFNLVSSVTPPNSVKAVREIDLAGNTVREITIPDLTAKLQAAGYNLTLQQFHHDVAPLANGHWLVLSNTLKAFTDLPGYPGTTNVLGDVVIDLDENMNPVWVWNEFDHLDVNRHPWMFPDWTHTNTILYSPTDGNLIVSMRHQNWVVKVDYANGAGSGNILWRLGEGGDFKLVNGTDPTDWNYAQHFPSFFSSNTAGVFSLGLMNNGDDREFPTGYVCDQPGGTACLYTSIPVFQIDETAKTATVTSNQIIETDLYSNFGGNTELLANGNIEFDLAGVGLTSDVFEVTPGSNPQTVWFMHTANNAYRAYRIPSLYPGVQW